MPFSAKQVLTAAQLNDFSVNTVTTTGNITVGGKVDAAGSVEASGGDGGAVIRAWQGNTAYAMFGTVNMAGSEYGVITNGTDTLISSGTGGATYLRGPANDSDPQLYNDGSRIYITGSAPRLDLRETTTTGVVTVFLGQSGNDTEGFDISYNSGTGYTIVKNVYAGGTFYLQSNQGDTTFVEGGIGIELLKITGGRQVLWGGSLYHGRKNTNSIVGTTATVVQVDDDSLPSISSINSWVTVLSVSTGIIQATVNGATRYLFGADTTVPIRMLWGLSCYTSPASRFYTRILISYGNGSTSTTAQWYHYFNAANQHQWFGGCDTVTFNQSFSGATFSLQFYGYGNTVYTDVNDSAYLWAFIP